MIRLFIALEIPKEIRTLVLDSAQQELTGNNDLRWEDENKIHVTLKFIGDVPKKMVNGISNSMQFIETYSSMKCSLANFGFFPDEIEPKILWAGLKPDNSVFSLLNEINNELLKKFSIPVEWKKFKPHLTLLRLRSSLEKHQIENIVRKELPQETFVANGVILYQSILQPGGSVYKEIKKYKLR